MKLFVNKAVILVTTLLLIPLAALHAADLELTETLQLPECHSLGWARSNSQPVTQKMGAWVVDPVLWQQAVLQKGEGKKEDTTFSLWVPDGIEYVKGIVVISGHGSGEALYKHPEMRKLARGLHLAIFKFIGNPMQRGFWPTSLLYERLKDFGEKSKHPELEHAPLFLYGHSNGTGFSAIFPATESERVWAWVSMRPGTTQMVDQPRAAQAPGMVMFGEDDPFFAKPSQKENLAIVEAMRKDHAALWNYAVEPKTGHGPGEKSWPLVFSFLRHTWAARVPADADPRTGPVKLTALTFEGGYLGKNWNLAKGGYQTLPIAPFVDFTDDKSTSSWLINADFAADWQAFQRDGQVAAPLPGKISDYRGYQRHDFVVDACPTIVVAPKKAAPGKPWIWRAEFFDAFPQVDLALLDRGFHLVHIRVGNTFGCPDALAHWDVLYKELTEKYGLSRKPVLEGLSRGGLYCFNWAANNRDKVGCILADNAVLDFKSWPGGKGKGKGSPGDWKKLLQDYHFASEAEALAYTKNPVDNLAPLAKAKVPLFLLCGDADDVVPYPENGAIVKERYEKLAGPVRLLIKKGLGHHPHGLDDPTPVVEYILEHR